MVGRQLTRHSYGHQSAVRAIDTMSRYERALTVGEDCTCRLWKVAEESQLMFRGQSLSIDCCAHLNEELFFTGSQDGYDCNASFVRLGALRGDA